MVLVYDIKDYLNVLPVSKQSFSQVWGDLKRNKMLLLSGHPPIRTLHYTETTSSTPPVSGEITINTFNHKKQHWWQFRPQIHAEGHFNMETAGDQDQNNVNVTNHKVFVICYTTKWLKGNWGKVYITLEKALKKHKKHILSESYTCCYS